MDIVVRKPFDQGLFEENDPKTREVVKAFFARRNIMLQDNPDKFGVDLIDELTELKVEVERRSVWKTGEFPFGEINLPERKAKFFKDKNTCYVIVSEDYAYIGGISGSKILGYLKDPKENQNKYVAQGEKFYKIPKNQFKWYKI